MKRLLNIYRVLSFERACRELGNDKEFINIGPTPHNESCTQAGEDFNDSIFECTVYIRQLIRTCGPSPEGCEFFIIQNIHEFGIYYDVNIFYRKPVDEENEAEIHASNIQTSEEELLLPSEEYALKVENGLDNWDDEAKEELIEGEHHLHVAKVIKLKKSA